MLSLATRRKYSGGDNLNYTRGGQPEAKYGQVVEKIASVYSSGVHGSVTSESSLAPLSLGDEISFSPLLTLPFREQRTSIVNARNFGESQPPGCGASKATKWW